MTKTRIPVAVAVTAALALSACNNPAYLDPDASADPNSNTKQGALIGGLVGAGLGALSGASSKTTAVVAGAAAGAALGGVIGNQLDQQAAELRGELANDGITIENTGDRLIVSLPQDITFDVDSYTVRPSLRPELDKVAQNLLKYPNSTVQVLGHTDSDGDATYNIGLSLRRANAVADVIQAGGVPFNRIQTQGLGESQPVASNPPPHPIHQ